MNNDLTKEQVLLVQENLKLVCASAMKWASEGYYQECYNAALVGIVTAAKHYQADRGVKFPSYAMWYIKREINLTMRNKPKANAKTDVPNPRNRVLTVLK